MENVTDVGTETIIDTIVLNVNETASNEIANVIDIDDSVVVTANVNESAPAIVSGDTVIVDAIPNPAQATPDRNPLVDFFQNLFQGPGAPQPQYALDPPDDCPKCS